ncbi:unnamed protein product [Symbiodinium sp. CCMP2592]|nr:unnamed protein product [Symbiodinium sp. CCMP2592]
MPSIPMQHLVHRPCTRPLQGQGCRHTPAVATAPVSGLARKEGQHRQADALRCLTVSRADTTARAETWRACEMSKRAWKSLSPQTELVLLQLSFLLSPSKCPGWCEAGMSHCFYQILSAAAADLQCRDPSLQLALRVASPSRILCDARVHAFRGVGARAMVPSAHLPWQKVSYPKALEPRSQRASKDAGAAAATIATSNTGDAGTSANARADLRFVRGHGSSKPLWRRFRCSSCD